MPQPEESETLMFAAADVAAELVRWLSHLGAERRMSPKTVEAYERDVRQFLGFLTGHLGELVTLASLAAIEPRDVRAFMAARRGEGIGSRSLMRSLAGARSFARFLERDGKGKIGALSAVRAPKLPKTLPKPIAAASAKRLTDADLRAGEEREPWVLARDAAVLALLYGSGLRISEALGLTREAVPAPGKGDVIIVTGKGNKRRMVPVLPAVQNLILAARAHGVGTVLTTLHRVRQDELRALLGIPREVEVVVLLPLGYPEEPFRPVVRPPVADFTYRDRWDERW